jgi:hypothetical protein
MSPAVIAIVKGGLGNQLFIYAAARALALRTGRTLHLDTTRGYTNDDYGRSYRLNRFPIQQLSRCAKRGVLRPICGIRATR